MDINHTYKLAGLIPIFFIMSCSGIRNLSDYDSSTAKRIEQTAEKIDKLYLSITELTEQGDKDRSYDKYAKSYLAVEVDIRAIVFKLSSQYTQGAEDGAQSVLSYWQDCKQLHNDEDANISDAQLNICHRQSISLLKALHFSETSKE
ncbi:MAG: hypothetical protein ACK5MG_04870 [Bacteroidales bacterium]